MQKINQRCDAVLGRNLDCVIAMDCISPASGAMDAAVLRQKIRYAAGSATAETIGDRAEGQAAVRMLWGNAAGILLDAARHFAERTAVQIGRAHSELQSLM